MKVDERVNSKLTRRGVSTERELRKRDDESLPSPRQGQSGSVLSSRAAILPILSEEIEVCSCRRMGCDVVKVEGHA